MSQPRVLVCGSWETESGYPRPRTLLAALRDCAVVAECRVELPVGGAGKRRIVARPQAWPGVAMRLVRARRTFLARLRRSLREFRPDAVVVPYPGHIVAPWVRSAFDGPILLDLFLSAFDTAVVDRELFRPRSPAAGLLRWLDRRACRAATRVLLDTPQHARWVAEIVGLPVDRFGWLPVSDPDAPGSPPPYEPAASGEPFEVLFFGTGVPLHGLEHLLQAVGQVPAARLCLAGGTAEHRATAATSLGERVRILGEFVPWLELARELERCHLVAGVFSDRDKARRVVPFKVVHALSAGRPVLTAETPAVCELLEPGVDVLVCRPADAGSIAGVLSDLAQQPDELRRVAAAGRATYEARFSTAAVTGRLQGELARMGVMSERCPEPELLSPVGAMR